ncbi:MAG: flavodoxin family protein [Candidatus Portnoybacteria bacterium]|nr:flavodoxin family protein [Candidatus Portnoybacteria bacterium]
MDSPDGDGNTSSGNGKIKVLGISSSTRVCSRSEKMLKEVLKSAEDFGGETELIRLADMNIKPCRGCCSEEADGCVYPCVDTDDDTNLTLEKMIEADSFAFASPVRWGSLSELQRLIEKMTPLEDNRDKLFKQFGREPLLGKPFTLVASEDYEGVSLAFSQVMWALNRMGLLPLPYVIHRMALLDRRIVQIGLRFFLGYRKLDWIDNEIRLAGRNLVLFPQLIKNAKFIFDDYKVIEPTT